MRDSMCILLTGERQAGKSFLVRRLLRNTTCPLYGFVTKMEPEGADGLRRVYMHPAAERLDAWTYTAENLVGICDRNGVREIYPQVFDTLGVSLLQQARGDGIVVMDELGFMEASSEAFTRQVLRVLEGEVPVVAVVKKRPGVAFLDKAWQTSGALRYEVTPENREALYQSLLPLLP